jgi:hypothetical protein
MDNLLESFLRVKKELSSMFTEQTVTEDYTAYSAEFASRAESIKGFFKKQENKILLDSDDISIKFSIDESNSIFDNDLFSLGKYLKNNQLITVSLTINKQILFELDSNELVFIERKSFEDQFHFQNKAFKTFFENVNFQSTVSLYLPIETKIKSDYINIYPIGYRKRERLKLSDKNVEYRNKIIKHREEFTRAEAWIPVPQIFNVITRIEEIDIIFKRNLFFCCLLHISNKYQENTFTLRGQKNIQLQWNNDYNSINPQILYSIFVFAYGESQVEDKLEIARNIFTIYLHDETINSLDNQLDKMKQTIERHFSMYVQEKIKTFFDDTKDAIDLAHKYALEARETADKIVSNINTTNIALITAVFSGAIVLSRGNYSFLVVALSLHILYLILSYMFNRHFAIKKKGDIEYIYDLTSDKFTSITEEEKKDIKEKYVTPSLDSIDKNIKKYFWLNVFLIAVMVVLIIGALSIQTEFIDKIVDFNFMNN